VNSVVIRGPIVFLAVLAAACGTGPRRDFHEDVTVHFILQREMQPKQTTTLRPVFTVGETVVHAPAVTFGPEHALVQEVAVVRAARDSSARISFWDPMTKTRARDTLKFDHELWIVIDVDEFGTRTDFDVYRYPPNRSIQEWRPLTRISE